MSICVGWGGIGDVDEFQKWKAVDPGSWTQEYIDLPWHLEPAAKVQTTLVVPVSEVWAYADHPWNGIWVSGVHRGDLESSAGYSNGTCPENGRSKSRPRPQGQGIVQQHYSPDEGMFQIWNSGPSVQIQSSNCIALVMEGQSMTWDTGSRAQPSGSSSSLSKALWCQSRRARGGISGF